MKQIWAPWRVEYINDAKNEGCFFCNNFKVQRDTENYILFRGKYNFVIMNKYPYNSGHLMVVPVLHTANLGDLSDEAMSEHLRIVNRALIALKTALRAQGFNVGMNLGQIAGAGVADHLHTHIVPRWNGDTNYMPVIADIRVIPEALKDTYEKILKVF
ncbi:MAG: HIT domain-containing protein [Chloroflexi bacterium]|nr:HIT domain-containing protein [Chloroflexota bacterium]